MQAPFGNDNRQPSAARANGRQAMAEAIQHHMDRLGPNKTKAVYDNPHPQFMSPRAPARSNVGGGDPLGIVNAVHRGWNHPIRDPGHGFNPLDVAGQLAHQTASMFNPTTKAGLANIASAFAGGGGEGGMGEEGGIVGDASAKMGELGMPGQFTRYGSAVYKTGSPLDRGITNEGPGYPNAQGAGIRGLVRRAEGTGRYGGSKASPLDFLKNIEEKQAAQSRSRAYTDENKLMENQRSGGLKQAADELRMHDAFTAATGHPLDSYNPAAKDQPFVDRQTSDFRDRNTLLNLANRNPGNDLLPHGGAQDPIKQALYDMLFGGKGLLKRPPRPGGGYPYGGGPFG